jgi:hypothetical protein
MREKHEIRASVEHIADEEIMSAIRYLDPDSTAKSSVDNSRTFLIICVSLIVVLAGSLAYIWLYFQTL